MSNITISNLAVLKDLEDGGKSIQGGASRRRRGRGRRRQNNNLGFNASLRGDVNQVTLANSQGNNVGGDQVVIANAQANLAVRGKNNQANYGDFWVEL